MFVLQEDMNLLDQRSIVLSYVNRNIVICIYIIVKYRVLKNQRKILKLLMRRGNQLIGFRFCNSIRRSQKMIEKYFESMRESIFYIKILCLGEMLFQRKYKINIFLDEYFNCLLFINFCW